MAKIRANGAHEVARWEREGAVTDPERHTDWEREELLLRSDGVVLTKLTVHFKPDAFKPEGYRHDWGWKRRGRAKSGGTAEAVEKLTAVFAKRGFRRAS